MKKRKILSVISVIGPHGGTSNKLKALISGSKHEHYVYCPLYNREINAQLRMDYEWFTETGIYCKYSCHGRNIFPYIKDIIYLIRKYNIEIVHFYFNFENTFVPLLKLWCPNVIFVRSIVGYDAPLSSIRHFLLNNTLKYTNNYIFISQYIKTLYEKDYPLLKKKNSIIIYNGAVNVKISSTPYNRRRALVSTSGLCERKNVEVLVEAMSIIINDEHREIMLYILGDGPLRPKIESLINKYGIQKYVCLVGYTNSVADYLDKCSIYVHPATTEGFGIAVTEAMFMKCPCIGANAGALPELIANGENGFIVDPYDARQWADKIIQLMDDPQLAYNMSLESYRRATEMFPLQSFIDNHDKYYTELSKN